MMDFWLVAALMVLVAMALVLMPMIRSSQKDEEGVSDKESNIAYFKEQEGDLKTQVEQGLISEEDAELVRSELEKKLLNDVAVSESNKEDSYESGSSKRLGLIISVLVPLLAIPLYMKLGAGTEIKVTRLMMSSDATSEQITDALEGWSEKRPDNAQALYMLGGRYMASGDFERAEEVYIRFYNVTNGSAQAAAELAQTVFLANDNTVTKRVKTLYEEALFKDENNTTALGLQGINAFAQEDYHKAISVWRKASQLERDPVARQSLNAGINRAKKMLGETIAEVRVNIDLAPELRELPPGTRVIVFARQPGVRAPIAAVPLRVGDLPQEIVLDENSAMMMGGSLAGVKNVDVVARISLRGDVSTADFQAEVKGVEVGDNSVVKLLIAPAS